MADMKDMKQLADQLRAIGQEHLFQFADELSAESRGKLLSQVETLDLEGLPGLIRTYIENTPDSAVPHGIEPAPYYPFLPQAGRSGGRVWDKSEFRTAGELLLKRGKVAAFTVAGGQGSRLGFEGPKGLFPAGAVTGKTLFQFFAEGLLAASRKYGAPVPWYIMTSPLNHEATVEYFEKNGHLGLDPRDVMFFPQGTIPSFEMGTGRILLAAKDELATNPDGHGGSLKALFTSGAIDDMRSRGIQHISYFQVDNPLVRVVDPVFLGLHASAPDSSGEMSSKMIPKTGPEEKLGVFCSVGGRVQVIEYSDLPKELAQQRLEDGSLRFLAGSIAVHILSVEFVARLNTDTKFSLPYHRAEKKIPHIDLATGRLVQPDKNNGIKLERFVFDALPMCRGSIVFETSRAEEFAPIKNATGVDSVESSHRLQTQRAARWLAAQGVAIPRDAAGEPDCSLEISPLTAMEAEDLQRNAPRPIPAIGRGEKWAI